MANKITSNGTTIEVGMNLNTTKAYSQFTTAMNKFRKEGVITTEIEIDGDRFTKAIRQYKDDMGNLIEQTSLFSRSWGEVYNSVTKIETPIEQVAKKEKELAEQTKQAAQQQEKFNATVKKSKTVLDDFIDTFLKMAKFNTINMIYDGLIDSMSDAIEIVKNFNDVMTEFKKVSDLQGESLQNYTAELGELGSTVARTTSEMVEGATSFKKSGFTDEDSAKLAQLSAMFQNIADEELEASEAANILISVMKGFDIGVENAEHIADTINEVSNNFAVSSTDISQGLGNVAAVSHTAGNSLEETIGMLTAMVEVSRSASKSSRGLIQITTRLSQTLDEGSSTGKKLREIYESLGIALEDENGQLRSSYDILKDLASKWNGLSDNQKKYIALTSSGANQINNFTALMSNFETAIDATQSALESQGSAAEENRRYMESMSATITAIKSEFEKLVLGEGGLESFVLSLLKAAKGAVEFVNDIGGLKTILTALGTVLAMVLIPHVTSLLTKFTSLMGVVPALVQHFQYAKKAGVGFSAALSELAVGLNLTQLAIQGVVAVIGIAVVAYNAYQRAQEEAHQKSLEIAQQAKDDQKALLDTAAKVKSEATSRQELASIIKNELGDAYDEEKEDLKEINELREEGLQALYEEARQKAQETINTTGSQYGESSDYLETSDYYRAHQGGTKTGETFFIEGTPEQRLEAINNKLTEYNNKQQEGIELSRDEENMMKTLEEEYAELDAKIKDAKEIVEAYNQAQELLSSTFDEWLGKIEESSEVQEEYDSVLQKFGYETLEDLQNAIIEAGGSEEDFAQAFSDGVDALDEYAESVLNAGQSTTDAFAEANEEIATHIDNLQGIQSAYETLSAAVEEYNSTGSFTAETLAKLNKLTAEQMAALELNNGVASVSIDLLQQQFEAEKQECVLKLQVAKNIAIVQLAQQYLNTETQNTNSTLESAQETNAQTATSYGELGAAARDAANAVHEVQAAFGLDSDEYKNFLGDRQKIVDDYNNMIDEVKNTQMDFSSTSKSSAKSASSAHKDAAKETKDAWKEAFEEEKRQLKHMLETDEINEYEYYERLKDLNEKYFGEISGNHEKYIKEYQENEEEIYKGMKSVYDKVKDYLRQAVESGYEKAISALEKEEKQVLASIRKQIDALKKEKESVIKGIEKEIDALNKEKEETLKGIEKEIDGLKKKKEQVEEYWNDQIDAIKRENEVLEQQNQLLEYQQALQQAKAQKVMIMQNGRFQLGENESAVSQAEQNLSNYEDQLSYEQQIQQMEDLRDAEIESIEERIEALEEYKEYTEEYYEERIEALEEYKEYMEEYYDAQIEAMEAYYEQVQEQYEKQIEALQAELDAFKEGYQKAEDLENANLATSAMAANEEANIWRGRLENLATAITEYNRLLTLLGETGATASAEFSPSSISYEPSANIAEVGHTIKTRASGDSNFKDDDIALVGESPNAELVIGSRLNRSVNSGELMHLSKGSGVVNAESTQTLAGLLNGIAKPNNVSNNRSVQQNFNFGNVSLPNVTDADSFVNTLSRQFNNYAIQYGNKRT